MPSFIKKILSELEYRSNTGIIDLSKPDQIRLLESILKDYEINDAKSISERASLKYIQLNEKQSLENVLDSTFKNPDTGRNVKVATALGYEKSSKAYGIARNMLKKSGYSEDDIELVDAEPEDAEQSTNVFGKKGGASVFGDKPTKVARRVISGKDKTLEKVETTKTKEFLQKQIPDDSKFEEKNKKYKIGTPPEPYKLPKEVTKNPKVPPRHFVALERMMNTRFSNDTAKWSHFSDLPGGAGQISAQAGELMTLISTTLDNDAAEKFFTSLFNHEKLQVQSNPNLKSESSRIVTKSWIQAASNNRKAIKNRIEFEYPDSEIVAGAWDTEGEVNAMGLSNYKQNKGFSTDAYFKLKTKDGEEILDEVSLKKSTTVNFLNSGTGKFLEWDSNLPDDINPNVYSENQRKSLSTFISKNFDIIKSLAEKDKEYLDISNSKKINLQTALEKLKKGGGSRSINKVALSAISAAAKAGNKEAEKYMQNVQKVHKEHQHNVVKALGSNPKLKKGMLNSIREEFPLKAVGEGEESMAIGPYSLDRQVLKNIFETSNFEEIKEGLFAVTNEDPPYLAYKAGKKGKVIPIATISVREDGVGYGGQIKFEMQLDRRFAKILEQSNKEIYG
jgi:hypothetical protein